jgi:hypothetical protein
MQTPYSPQQSLLLLQLASGGLQAGRLAVTDMIDVDNATMTVRKEKRIVWLRWYELLSCSKNLFEVGRTLVKIGK